MIFSETYDYLFSQLAAANDAGATTREKDYRRKRLRRALLSRSIKPYILQASWINAAGTAGEESIALTLPVTKPLIILDGAIRTSNPTFVAGRSGQLGSQEDFNNFELQIIRTAGDSRVQIADRFIKDEHLLTPAQAAIRAFVPERLGQGAPNPLIWPVPLRLRSNELLQVKSRVLAGGIPSGRTTFTQFRGVIADNDAEDESLIADLEKYIAENPVQRPGWLSMFSEDAKSIAFPATGALQRTTARTRESSEHLLIIGYAALFARSTGLVDAGALRVTTGTTCSPRWRLQSSNGHAFSQEEIDLACYAYPGPGFFWAEFPQPFLLPKGSSLSASFSTLTAIQNAVEQIDNYVFFRYVTV